MGWEINKANNTRIFPISLCPNHTECCGRAHMSACGWVWVCLRVKFSFATLRLHRQKNSIIPRSQTQVKSAVWLKETRCNLKPQMENRGKKKLSGWLYNRWSSCQQPKTGSYHLIVFQEIQMTHHLVLWFISRPACSVLALDHVDPALGRAGRNWDRHLLDFLHSLLCLHPGRNPPALFNHITQFVLFVRQRAPWGLRCLLQS